MNDRHLFIRLSVFVISLAGIYSCENKNQPGNEPDKKFDSLILKADSLNDTIGKEIRDVNEGVSGGAEELKDGATIRDSINP